MTLFRTVDGGVQWFDNAGSPINQDGSPRGGPSLAELGGPDGTYPDPSFAPDAPPPPPPPIGAPPPALPGGFHNLNVYVRASSGGPVVNATVLIGRDYGNGTERTTDGNGFANFGVGVGYAFGVHVAAAGHQDGGTSVIVSDTSDHWVNLALSPVAAPAGTGTTPGTTTPGASTGQPIGVPATIVLTSAGELGALTPVASTAGDAPPAFGPRRVALEVRGGVPSFAADAFSGFDVPTFGFSPGGIILGIVSGLIGLFKGSSGSADVSRLTNVVQNMGQLVLSLASTLADFTARSVHTDTQSGNIFEHLLTGVLGPIINALASVIRGGSSDLAKLFGPISDSLKKLLGAVRHLYDTWLRPLLKFIDTTRQILRVLEAFHFKWAAAADAALGRLEGKLSAPLLLAIKQLNLVSNQVNRIVTLDGALQRVTLVRSHIKHAACINNVWWNSQASPAAANDGATVAPFETTTAPSDVLLAWKASDGAGAGPYDDTVNAVIAAWKVA